MDSYTERVIAAADEVERAANRVAYSFSSGFAVLIVAKAIEELKEALEWYRDVRDST